MNITRTTSAVDDGALTWALPNKVSPLIYVSRDGIEYAQTKTEKREFLNRRSGMLLFAWGGQYKTDVLLVDDRRRLAALLS